MLFNSLRSKLTFATSLTASIILGVVITYAVIASKKKAIEAAKIEFQEKAERVTLKLKGTIDNSFSVLQTQNTIFKTLNNNGVLTKSTSIDLIKSIDQLIEENAKLKKALEHFELAAAGNIKETLKKEIQTINGIQFLAKQVNIQNADSIKNILFDNNKIYEAICILMSYSNENHGIIS